jgi:hypothetical protein
MILRLLPSSPVGSLPQRAWPQPETAAGREEAARAIRRRNHPREALPYVRPGAPRPPAR